MLLPSQSSPGRNRSYSDRCAYGTSRLSAVSHGCSRDWRCRPSVTPSWRSSPDRILLRGRLRGERDQSPWQQSLSLNRQGRKSCGAGAACWILWSRGLPKPHLSAPAIRCLVVSIFRTGIAGYGAAHGSRASHGSRAPHRLRVPHGWRAPHGFRPTQTRKRWHKPWWFQKRHLRAQRISGAYSEITENLLQAHRDLSTRADATIFF